MKNLHTVMFATNISDHELADDPKIGYTYKAMGAGFWALRQTDFRKAMETIILEVKSWSALSSMTWISSI